MVYNLILHLKCKQPNDVLNFQSSDFGILEFLYGEIYEMHMKESTQKFLQQMLLELPET